MEHRIRRQSMERLKLYDLEKFNSNQQVSPPPPPPLPPPRKHRRHLPADFAFQRYQFLCDMTRHRTDPVYAATPMFTTIPQTKPIKYQRRVFGRRIPSSIITPKTPKSTEPQSANTDKHTDDDEEEEESNDGDDHQESDSDDGPPSESSSSSSSSSDDGDDFLDDNDNQKGIVEQIFNRDQQKN